ncbi:MAG: metal-dependent transcriptional regulator [Actinobacteria bacterium]|nr:metal-dependent transcriptional regulator [Actinomycetota bacterium]
MKATPASQDYLKALCQIGWERPDDAVVGTKDVADRLGVSAASATNMLKKLGSMGLVDHQPYRGAALTDGGRKIALEVIRHHRLLETYLAEALGVPWERVHDEAEVLEHVLSEDLEDRIAATLGDPSFDPHGHPIPTKDGSMPEPTGRPLWDARDGEQVAVTRVRDHNPATLTYLAEVGIRPGANLEIVERGPVGGPLFVKIEGADEIHAFSRELSESVWVS